MEREDMHRQLGILDENPKEIDQEEQEEQELEEQQNSAENRRRKNSKPKRPFPTYLLEDAIKIPQVIRQFNGGNAWSPDDIVKALEMGKGNNFYYLTASSRDYGFTEGTSSTQKIALASIGKSIVYARSAEEEKNGYSQAFFRIPLFKTVHEYYDGRTLPQITYLKNTLITEFNIDEEFHDDFYKVYQANLNFLSKLEETTPNKSSRIERVEISTNKEHSADAFILGEPEEKTTLVAFVAMPFSEKTAEYPESFFDEVLTQLITPAAIQAGFKAETAKKKGSDVIQSTIINDLSKADLVIVDLTEHNPNVLFELGWRMALDKPIALIRALGTKPIFDVDHMLRVYDYNPRLWRSSLEKDIPALADHIKASWDNRDSDNSYAKILRDK
ncbi:MAG: hypothetical protein KME50_07210 [Nostoc desertorum CM1-VF14]|jgi:hypothetical protein|nr:hypothetical protein [Nostoc desertorum CM1-VF14]